MIKYKQYTKLNAEYVKSKIAEYLEEDCANLDVTTLSSIKADSLIGARITAEEDMVFAGREIIENAFPHYIKVEVFVKNGERLSEGTTIAKIYGNAQTILSRERVMLNIIQRLCGIASTTSKYVKIAAPHKVQIFDTRKTTPGLRLFEKFAVTCGGGTNHRFDLASGILIKDNHIKAAGGVVEAIRLAKLADSKLPIELEVDTIEQITEALVEQPDGFLLDNMSPDECRNAVKLIRESEYGKDIFIEASGGITLLNLEGYMDTGIDAISIGALTHSIKSSSIHLEFE